MNLVILQSDVVLVDVVPLLNAQLLGPRAALRRHQLLQVADGVVLAVGDKAGILGLPFSFAFSLGVVRVHRRAHNLHRGTARGAEAHAPMLVRHSLYYWARLATAAVKRTHRTPSDRQVNRCS